MMYSAANNQKSNTCQYPTDKKVRKLFEVPTYFPKYECSAQYGFYGVSGLIIIIIIIILQKKQLLSQLNLKC